MEKKPTIDEGDIIETNTEKIRIDLAKKLEKINQRSGGERKGPSTFDKIPRFRGDYANAYSAHLMFLGMGKDFEYVKKYFPILKFNEYSEMKIRQEIAAENKLKPEEIQAEVENRLQNEAKENNQNDHSDIEEVDRLVGEVNNDYQEALKLDLPAENKEETKKTILAKLKQIDNIVKRK